MVVSIKVPSTAFPSLYYVGEVNSKSSSDLLNLDRVSLINPVRFCEIFQQQRIPSKTKPEGDVVNVPVLQSIEEGGIAWDNISVPLEGCIVSEITNDSAKHLLDAYLESIKMRAANKAGLILPQDSGKVARPDVQITN